MRFRVVVSLLLGPALALGMAVGCRKTVDPEAQRLDALDLKDKLIAVEVDEERAGHFAPLAYAELQKMRRDAVDAFESADYPAASLKLERALEEFVGFTERLTRMAWTATVTGDGSDIVRSIHGTRDGGYIMAGSTTSEGAGSLDVLVVKLDGDGRELWRKTFGGKEKDLAYSVRELDDGFIVVGRTDSYRDWTGDIFLVRTDTNGNEVWRNSFGKMGTETGVEVIPTNEGGYLVVGRTFDGPEGMNVLMLGVDDEGNELWRKSLGGKGDDMATTAASHGDHVLIGGGKGSLRGDEGDALILRADWTGEALELNTVENSAVGSLEAVRVTPTYDGGFAIVAESKDGEKKDTNIRLSKVDKEGKVEWSKEFGGRKSESPVAVIQVEDAGFLVVGTTESYGAGGKDILLLRTDALGEVLWNRTIGSDKDEEARAASGSSDGGFVIAATVSTRQGRDEDILIVKTDSLGRSWNDGPIATDDLVAVAVETSEFGGLPEYSGPDVGDEAPEITAEEWINTEDVPSLDALRGKVVVLEFWATWCGPCRQSTPHLVEIHDAYGEKGVVLLSLTDEKRSEAAIDEFLDSYKVSYIVGTGSNTINDYKVHGIPSAYVIDGHGVIQWRGHPMVGLEEAIQDAIESENAK